MTTFPSPPLCPQPLLSNLAFSAQIPTKISSFVSLHSKILLQPSSVPLKKTTTLGQHLSTSTPRKLPFVLLRSAVSFLFHRWQRKWPMSLMLSHLLFNLRNCLAVCQRPRRKPPNPSLHGIALRSRFLLSRPQSRHWFIARGEVDPLQGTKGQLSCSRIPLWTLGPRPVVRAKGKETATVTRTTAVRTKSSSASTVDKRLVVKNT
jgi:hypothetical protein